MAGLGGAFGGLIGNSTLQQIVLYNVVGSLIGAALAPFLTAVHNHQLESHPVTPLSPDVAAEAVLRNVWDRNRAASEALQAGVNPDRFDVLARLAGNAPGPGDMAVALRRGLVDEGRYLTGIRQGRLRDEWAELVKALAVQDPSPLAPLNAYLEGQLSEGQARQLYARFGGNPDHFEWQYNAQGTAPTPLQAAEMARRGIIAWDGEGPGVVSYRQAFLEGPWRNKWEQPFRVLSEYLPPPRTVTAMYREGSLSRAEAADLLAQQGLRPELVEAYLFSGSEQRVEADRTLALGTVRDLYRDRLIDRAQAAGMLAGLGYDAADAGFILQVADAQLAQRFLSAAVGRVRSRYTAWKIERTAARDVLAELGVAGEQASDLLAIWDIERSANTATLTAAQVGAALREQIIAEPEARRRLTEMGYSPRDAWVYLSQAVNERLPDEPPPD
ncbi:MAG: hypothetical protein ACRDHD_11420 [Candidatus Limnocylindria bacterium]